ncbi:MAG: ABC transporter permease [Alphaproteobacteria bacterium]|jgi:peptide/nickel transport system permease protein|nr:ABC transporter permease [Alphaproteobacteria bacterium]MDP6565986.1 ABC transporter permease [Alphaproteobacteria bacterium]
MVDTSPPFGPTETALADDDLDLGPPPPLPQRLWQYARRHPTVVVGLAILVAMAVVSIAAPLLASDPLQLDPIKRLLPPSEQYWFGTDFLGREVYSRVIHGGRISLTVGLAVALIATVVGLFIGLLAGYVRAVDAVVMRIMDGLMAIPGVLLAIALISLAGASVTNVIIAITIPEVPRVVRLVRAVVLTIREQPYVEAAVSVGTKLPKILWKHILPNTMAPLIVQATYVCASAIVIEAILSFLGAGTPPEIPSWGNIMAEGRSYFQTAPWMIFFPGLLLAVTVLAVNILGDGLRDSLDPRIARRM